MKTFLLDFALGFLTGGFLGTVYGVYLVHKIVGDVNYIASDIQKYTEALKIALDNFKKQA